MFTVYMQTVVMILWHFYDWRISTCQVSGLFVYHRTVLNCESSNCEWREFYFQNAIAANVKYITWVYSGTLIRTPLGQ